MQQHCGERFAARKMLIELSCCSRSLLPASRGPILRSTVPLTSARSKTASSIEICLGDRLGNAIGSSKVLPDQFRRARLEQPSVLEILGLVAKSIEMARCEVGIDVRDHHIHARHRENLGDSATHVSGRMTRCAPSWD